MRPLAGFINLGHFGGFRSSHAPLLEDETMRAMNCAHVEAWKKKKNKDAEKEKKKARARAELQRGKRRQGSPEVEKDVDEDDEGGDDSNSSVPWDELVGKDERVVLASDSTGTGVPRHLAASVQEGDDVCQETADAGRLSWDWRPTGPMPTSTQGRDGAYPELVGSAHAVSSGTPNLAGGPKRKHAGETRPEPSKPTSKCHHRLAPSADGRTAPLQLEAWKTLALKQTCPALADTVPRASRGDVEEATAFARRAPRVSVEETL
ncbi:hypothetical protein C2845_PM14G10840 [Panicum miliaceum]|uniref:Uncharacterized protein n=1 Tax=Panicum miliaceum TaxID=4540 RepID=A0A3L6PL84_PANMI|nr:hypothetical protein C2845_PM14G10840 [Panicum miliaceum]